MKHNKEYKFGESVQSVGELVCRLRSLGYDHEYQNVRLADGSTHHFIRFDDTLQEIPDLDAALAWVLDDICLLRELYVNGIIIEDK